MSDSKVELKGFTDSSSGFSSPPAWQSPAVGDMNPTYQGINDQSNSIDPSVNERMYDFVPGNQEKGPLENPAPHPPPGRRTTTNTIYESSCGTLHPQTLPIGYSNGEVEPEVEYEEESSAGCVRTCVLSLLVVVSLFLAVVAVVLVLLLWFGVIDPSQCPAEASTVATEAVTGTDTPGCNCETLDILQSTIDRINEKTANLTTQIESLSNEVGEYSDQNANLTSETDSLDAEVNSVNSSCLNTLGNVTNQLGSIGGLNFNAQLLNVAVFNSCIYEYVDECLMPQTVFNCETTYVNTVVPGYSNIDLACHVGLSMTGGALEYAPITNLRFNTTGTDPLAPDKQILDESTVRCECSLVAINMVNPTRNEIFHCKMYRSRCLTTENFSTTIVT